MTAILIDFAVFTLYEDELAIALHANPGASGRPRWTLPAIGLHDGETLEHAVRRGLDELFGLRDTADISQFGTTTLDDGSGGAVLTIGHLVCTNPSSLRNLPSASGLALVPVAPLRSGRVELGSSSLQRLHDALDALGVRLDTTGVAPRLIDPPFTLLTLRRVYERVWDEPLNPANFRRALLPKEPANKGPARLMRPRADPTHNLEVYMRAEVRTTGHVDSHDLTSPHNTQDLARALWQSLGASTALPYLQQAGQTVDAKETYVASTAWEVGLPPIRRPRRRSSKETSDE